MQRLCRQPRLRRRHRYGDDRVSAAQLGLCTAGTRDAVLALLRQYGLPVDCAYPVEQMLGTILHDKKASGGSINLIVPTAVGSCEIRKTPASEISDWLRAGGAK